MNGSCMMQRDRYARDDRFAPYDAGARISPRQENGGETDTPSTPSTPLRPSLRPCPPRPGCDCAPPTRPECGFVPDARTNCTTQGAGRTSSNTRAGRQSRNDRRRTGCGCGCSGNGNQNALMEELRAVEFALDEVVLYLDAYPCDQAALDFYHHLLERHAPLVEQYQTEVGPLTPLGNTSRTSWDWTNAPFPWEYDANR